MNYYECIQKSIDYIESNLKAEMKAEQLACAAFMSPANFHRIFFAIVGHTAKEYIRLRRMSLAAAEIKAGEKRILDIAVRYTYENADSFARAFKKATGLLPSTYRKDKTLFSFERINIMEQYFERQNPELLDAYPDIKVLRTLEPFDVAAYAAHSKTPENDAFAVLKSWVAKNGFFNKDNKARLFGFDIPGSLRGDSSYGYEVWLTVPENYRIRDERMVLKHCPGGRYAVMSTTIGEITAAWDRFREWLKLSKYELGCHQYLEEHLPFATWAEYPSQAALKIDLYMPLQEKPEKIREIIVTTTVAYYRAQGKDREANAMKAWQVMLRWVEKHRLAAANHRIFVYNQGFRKTKNGWHEIMITIDDDFDFTDDLVKKKGFPGGTYMTRTTDRTHLAEAWWEMGQWQALTKTKGGKQQWLEQWQLTDWRFPETAIKVFYPIGT